jgi:hypothetical protein
MKLDKKNLTKLIKDIDFDELGAQVQKLDMDLDPEKINKLFKSLDIEKAKKGIEFLKSKDFQKSLSNIEPFSNPRRGSQYNKRSKAQQEQVRAQHNMIKRTQEKGVDMNVLNKLVDKIDIKKMTKKPRDNTRDSSRTVEQEFSLSKQNINIVKERVKILAGEIKNNLDVTKSLQNANNIIDGEKDIVKKKYLNDVRKKRINKRLTEFYDTDATTKKNIIGYLKILYFVFIGALVITVLYKKKYKEKKIYILFALLFLIPNYIINFIYETLINVIGHRRLDILYTSMIVLTTLLIIILFFAFKFILNKANLNNLDDLVNISKVKDNITNTIKSKSKEIKESVEEGSKKISEKMEESKSSKMEEKKSEESKPSE